MKEISKGGPEITAPYELNLTRRTAATSVGSEKNGDQGRWL
jgi:hypothetical protein